MILRKYRTEDCESIAGLFYETVHSVNAADYTPEQLDVWATGKVDLEAWDKSFREHFTIVAEETKEEKQDFGKRLLGFGDIDSTGYLDRLYVHKDHQRQGIASAICDELERAVPAEKITTHASITAKPFFLKRGGRLLINYVMEKVVKWGCDYDRLYCCRSRGIYRGSLQVSDRTDSPE